MRPETTAAGWGHLARHPADDPLPRLVYADYLDERDKPETAAAVRLLALVAAGEPFDEAGPAPSIPDLEHAAGVVFRRRKGGPRRPITRLTPAQSRCLPLWRAAWLRCGLATEPDWDRDVTSPERTRAVGLAYAAAHLSAPEAVVRADSPMAGCFAAHMLTTGGGGRQVGGQVWDQVGGQVWGQVGGQVRGQVGGQVWDQVWGQVGDQVWGQVGGQVRGQVRDQVRGQVRDQVWRSGYGSQDAGWLSFYHLFGRVCGLPACDRLAGLFALASCCGWWWPFERAVVVTPRPAALTMRDRKLVEVKYADGFGVAKEVSRA